jgi:hypothetical protein
LDTKLEKFGVRDTKIEKSSAAATPASASIPPSAPSRARSYSRRRPDPWTGLWISVALQRRQRNGTSAYLEQQGASIALPDSELASYAPRKLESVKRSEWMLFPPLPPPPAM